MKHRRPIWMTIDKVTELFIDNGMAFEEDPAV